MSLPQEMYADLKAQLPALTEAIKTGAEWGTDLAHRFIIYDIVTSTISALVGGVLLGVLLAYRKEFWNWVQNGADFDGRGAAWFFTNLIIGLFGAGFFFVNLHTIIKDIFIPEIRILELISNLI